MKTNEFKMKSKVWVYPGMASSFAKASDGLGGWHFLTLPKKQSSQIKKLFGDMAHGWGSLPVAVTIGKTTWKTSIFPDKKAGAYLLPLKAAVRKKENIAKNSVVSFAIEIKI